MSNAAGYLHRIALIIWCIGGSISARAQQNWFLYIQSESNQAFYVRIGETIYNSSSVGHLVINGLHDSTYRLAIGFPQTNYREHLFNVPVHKKDHGFELRRLDARSWELYEWQSHETIRSPRYDSLLYGTRKNGDAFASLLAAVVNDSAVLYTSVVKTEPHKKAPVDSAALAKEEKKKTDSVLKDVALVTKEETDKTDSVFTDTAIAVQEKILPDTATKESLVINTDTALANPVIQDSGTRSSRAVDTNATAVAKEEKTPAVTKLEEETANNEKKLVFLDNTIGIKKDTVTVIIPLENDSVKNLAAAETAKPPIEKERTASLSDSLELEEKMAAREENNADRSAMDSVAIKKNTDTARTARAEMKKIDSPPVEEVKETRTASHRPW